MILEKVAAHQLVAVRNEDSFLEFPTVYRQTIGACAARSGGEPRHSLRVFVVAAASPDAGTPSPCSPQEVHRNIGHLRLQSLLHDESGLARTLWGHGCDGAMG